MTTACHAMDWSLEGTVDATGGVTDNPVNQPNKDGAAWFAATGVDASLFGKTKVSELIVDFGVVVFRNAGPAAEETRNVEDFDTGLTYRRVVGATKFFSEIDYANAAASSSERDDSGLVDVDARRKDLDVAAGIDWQVNQNNAVTVSTHYSDIRFSGPSADRFTESSVLGTDVAWTHLVNSRAQSRWAYAYGSFETKTGDETKIDLHSLTYGVRYQLNSRVEIDGTAGFLYNSPSHTSQGGRIKETVTPLHKMAISYRRKRVQGVLSFDQSVRPSSLGTLQRVRKASVKAEYSVNPHASLSATAHFARQRRLAEENREGTDRTTYGFDLGYSKELTSEWTGTLAYALEFEDGARGKTSTNTGSITLTRPFTFYLDR